MDRLFQHARMPFALLFCSVFTLASAMAQDPLLIKDINPGSADSYRNGFAALGGTVYFFADDGVHGMEMWKSDGTTEGTVLVADIAPPSVGSFAGQLRSMSDQVLFSIDDGVHGEELWSTDGTASGTALVADINEGSSGSDISFLMVADDMMYFAANDAIQGLGLWKSDGTAEGTVLVRGGFVYDDYSFQEAAVLDGEVFFVGNDGTHDSELWRTDGTEEGTIMLTDISLSGEDGDAPMYLTVGENEIFFVATDDAHGAELWKSNGTSEGTGIVVDIGPGAIGSDLDFLSPFGNLVAFSADDGVHGQEIWTSDGTPDGTALLKDINPGPQGSDPAGHDVGGMLILTVEDENVGGDAIWRSDGTTEGTTFVKAVDTEDFLVFYAVHDGSIYFMAADESGGGDDGFELWTSDGTSEGTAMVADIRPGVEGASLQDLLLAEETLFFNANDGTHGDELWALSVRQGTAVDRADELPLDFILSSAYPNPFNPQTKLILTMRRSQAVRVEVYDVLGRRVAVLHEGILPGEVDHVFTFKANLHPSSFYVIAVTGEVFAASRNVMLLK